MASANDGTYRPVQTFPIALRFHIENAHTSIGILNEHFLHHRRSGCYHLCCKLPGFARLKVSSAPLLDMSAATEAATVLWFTTRPQTASVLRPRAGAVSS
jgi:hypothetical protein